MPNMIDVNRGVEIHRDTATGIRVYMYIDKPGEYLNAFAKPVSPEFAKKAGFPVEAQLRQKIARDKIADFTAKMAAELDVTNLTDTAEVLVERDGYRVLKMPYGNALVVGEDNEKLTPAPVPEQAALELLEALSPSGKQVDKGLEKPKPKA